MNKAITIFLTGLLLVSCHSEKKHDIEYYQFRKQLTPSGKYVIYNYAKFGPMAFSSDIIGTELFPVNEPFEEGEGKSITGSISEWISDDTLLVYNFKSELHQPKDTLPIKTEYESVGDFITKTVFYKTNSGSRSILHFDSVATTKNSIIIRTIPKKGKKELICFPLGGTTIQVQSDSITHIEISTRLHKSMDFVYKNPDGTYSINLPRVGTTWYDLTPTKKISPSTIQEKKVFWEN
ncbi:MAG TPA: hypothetical protein VE467_20810 [Chryseolinea sp.]|nr:hypothetical protein [Chryseolinea sp.]